MNLPNNLDFRPAEESIYWAKADLADFESEISRFFTRENITVVEEFDEASGLLFTIVRLTESITESIFKRHPVNALLNTRNSFDQAVNIAGTLIKGSKFKKNFPWSASLSDLETHRLTEFPEKLRDAIKVQEPYPQGANYAGGNDLIRALARLCNDKHSIGFTIDAIGGIDPSANLTLVGNGHVRKIQYFRPNWNPVKNEVVLFSVEADGVRLQLNKDARLRFDICLEVPELPNPPEVRIALNEFLAAAERNLELMKAACGE